MTGLREQAAADNRAILEDSAPGFGWPITVTDPNGVSAALVGFSNDVAQSIDPETGLAVSGRIVTVALSLAALKAAGLGMPRAIADSRLRPWLVAFSDVAGAAYTFTVTDTRPDQTVGCVVCTLGVFRE